MIHKKLEDISIDDINSLIENEISESRDLEYKRELHFDKKEAKQELLLDLCAFANAVGGDLIVGMEVYDEGEKKGLPREIIPITGESLDDYKQRIENLVRDCVEPRLRIYLQEILPEKGKGFILVIRVPQSFEAPHMVKGTSRFYVRTSVGKEPLDVYGIRNAFLASSSYEEQIRNWRNDRLAKITADETPVQLEPASKLVIHIIPIRSFLERNAVELQASDRQLELSMMPVLDHASRARHNLDGLLYSGSVYEEHYTGYTQLFRFGHIESVGTDVATHIKESQQYIIHLPFVAQETITAVSRYLNISSSLTSNERFLISLALLGVKGAEMPSSTHPIHSVRRKPIDRDNVVLPETIIEGSDCGIPRSLRPAIDALYNACGYKGSPDYDEGGNWNPQQ
jgi:predicted HTH transcriptional regulator